MCLESLKMLLNIGYLFAGCRRRWHNRLFSVALDLNVDRVVWVDCDGLVPGNPAGLRGLPVLRVGHCVEGRLPAEGWAAEPALGRRGLFWWGQGGPA